MVTTCTILLRHCYMWLLRQLYTNTHAIFGLWCEVSFHEKEPNTCFFFSKISNFVIFCKSEMYTMLLTHWEFNASITFLSIAHTRSLFVETIPYLFPPPPPPPQYQHAPYTLLAPEVIKLDKINMPNEL